MPPLFCVATRKYVKDNNVYTNANTPQITPTKTNKDIPSPMAALPNCARGYSHVCITPPSSSPWVIIYPRYSFILETMIEYAIIKAKNPNTIKAFLKGIFAEIQASKNPANMQIATPNKGKRNNEKIPVNPPIKVILKATMYLMNAGMMIHAANGSVKTYKAITRTSNIAQVGIGMDKSKSLSFASYKSAFDIKTPPMTEIPMDKTPIRAK